MASILQFDTYVLAIDRAAQMLVAAAESVDLAKTVPTCAPWTVRDLLAHQGEIHRWSTGHVSGEFSQLDQTQQAAMTAPPTDGLIDWYRQGYPDLLAALRAAPIELEALVFLKNAPTPREFWARRQAHETTIHAVDARLATLNRPPTAAESGIDPELALDGVDELVMGFLPRRKTTLHSAQEYSILIAPTDSERRWQVLVGPEQVQVHNDRITKPDATFIGTAVQLYLGLWNRGTEIQVEGYAGALVDWRAQLRI